MDSREIIKYTKVEKAPDAFTENLMMRIRTEKSIIPRQKDRELLKKWQKTLVLVFVLGIILYSIFSPTENGGESIISNMDLNFDLSLSSEIYAFFNSLNIDLLSLLSILTIVLITFMISELAYRKALRSKIRMS